MLRLWQTGSDEGLVWRCSLESPQSGERLGFASLPDLCAYLEREMSDKDQRGLSGLEVRGAGESGGSSRGLASAKSKLEHCQSGR
jgi:hypothetical protein